MKKLALIITGFALSISISGTAMAIPSFNSSNYKIVTDVYGWEYARDKAAELGTGWHLAVITSQAEQDFVAGLLDSYFGNNNRTGQFWIGGWQTPGAITGTEGWHWINGEAWSYTSWRAGEPNDYIDPIIRPNHDDEIYLTMDLRSIKWEWNDEPLYAWIGGYVAEYNAPVPEPSTLLLLGAGLAGIAIFRRRAKQ